MAVLPTDVVVSIVVVAREGFARAPRRLRELLDHTRLPFRLIYVDGGSPFPISGRIRSLVLEHGGTLLRSSRFLRPTQARNLGFQRVRTRYTVFLDNDVRVTDGWLAALVECADATGADYVSPVVCQPGNGTPLVHVAGGVNEIVASDEGPRLREEYAFMHRPYADVADRLVRREIGMAEFHAVLVRTGTLQALGGLDEACSTAFEHNDLCLAVRRAGGRGWLEPASLVDYLPDAPASYGNVGYSLLRWSRLWIEESHAAFCEKWGLRPDDPAFARALRSLHGRRRRTLRYLRGVTRRIAGAAAERRLDAAADRISEAWLRRRIAGPDVPVEVVGDPRAPGGALADDPGEAPAGRA